MVLYTSFNPAKPFLKKCKHCRNFFPKTTISSKIFCNNRCKWNYYYKERCKNSAYRKKINIKSLKYYYKNKKIVLPKQISYKMNRYKKDKKFHIKDNIRKYTAYKIKLKDKYCIQCGTNKDLQRHHKDYSKPLEIEILCRNCHNELHSKYHGNI